MTGLINTIGSAPFSASVFEESDLVEQKILEANNAVFEAVRLATLIPSAQLLFGLQSNEDIHAIGTIPKSTFGSCLESGIPIFNLRVSDEDLILPKQGSWHPPALNRTSSGWHITPAHVGPGSGRLDAGLLQKIQRANVAVFDAVVVAANDPMAEFLFDAVPGTVNALAQMDKGRFTPRLQLGIPLFSLRVQGREAGDMYRTGETEPLLNAYMKAIGRYVPSSTFRN